MSDDLKDQSALPREALPGMPFAQQTTLFQSDPEDDSSDRSFGASTKTSLIMSGSCWLPRHVGPDLEIELFVLA